MNVPITRIEPRQLSEDQLPNTGGGPRQSGGWLVIEELDQPSPPSAGRLDVRSALVVAAAAAIVVLGLLGSTAAPAAAEPDSTARLLPPPSATARSPLEIATPADGAQVDGSVVKAKLVATRQIGDVDVTVRMGGVVLGRARAEVKAAGAVSVRINACVPSAEVPVDLVVGASAGGEPIATRAFRLGPGGAVNVWSVGLHADGNVSRLQVAGCAPRAMVLSAGARTTSGTRVRTGPADLFLNGVGGATVPGGAIGFRAFELEMAVLDPVDPADVEALIRWADPAAGMSGFIAARADGD